jgi:hypothetical protein
MTHQQHTTATANLFNLQQQCFVKLSVQRCYITEYFHTLMYNTYAVPSSQTITLRCTALHCTAARPFLHLRAIKSALQQLDLASQL